MKKNALALGIAAAASPIPMLILTVLWSWFLFFVVGVERMDYRSAPLWMAIVSFLPFLVSPALGLIGLIQGIRNRGEKGATAGVFLSVIGLLETIVLFVGMLYFGSRF